ncbi:MgtC/SapB family protein [Alicyclobacillus fastidiosus]|uniref:MgtC/SapB family protein n=1 Tax=Alicyclobacillus fastidiosus TaxID=392011 RepID=A0ABY6ZF95_9BACL|nr:MgtC/SapB family protein [Alicyclobacillus fastidiosus]WAH41518.1 MgtC/SapB family protein [Alicyclobacillus fastidiosus]GMA63168.1 methyltransferase [Alicyclobacillus fastidiosus]
MNQNLEFILRLLLAGVLGAVIGVERKVQHKEAGVRTHFVVAVGSALMMLVSKYAFMDVVNNHTIVLDPSRIAAQVVSGIGFLGAGVIIFQRNAIRGLTTAAGVWATAGIGLAIGAGQYTLGIACAVLVLIGFVALKPLERRFIRNIQHILITANDRPGLIAKISAALEQLGLSIEQISIDRTDEEKDLVEIELYLRIQKQISSTDKVIIEVVAEIDGIKQVIIPSEM